MTKMRLCPTASRPRNPNTHASISLALVLLCHAFCLLLCLSSADGATVEPDSSSPDPLAGFLLLDVANSFGSLVGGLGQFGIAADGWIQNLHSRQTNGFTGLENNVPSKLNIQPGDSVYYIIQNDTLWGPPGNIKSIFPSPVDWNSDSPPVTGVEFDKEDEDDLFERDTGDDNKDGGKDPNSQSNLVSFTNRTVYITISTCTQPALNTSNLVPISNSTSMLHAVPPQLRLFISTSSKVQKPGPESKSAAVQEVILEEGYGSVALQVNSSKINNLYIAVVAPNVSSEFSGIWNYELAASVDSPYANFNNRTFLTLVDTDSTSVLFVTDRLTFPNVTEEEKRQWMSTPSHFSLNLFADPDEWRPSNESSRKPNPVGARSSVCGLTSLSQAASRVDSKAIDWFPDGGIRWQFHAQGLEPGKNYIAALALKSSTDSGFVGGGGQMWQYVKFSTKSDRNCVILKNMNFCSHVVYAVPYNPIVYPDPTVLAAKYDEFASSIYANFSRSLAQVPCNTTRSAQYSLAKGCDDCASAYKTWMCTVILPRCNDIGAPSLENHNSTQPAASRNLVFRNTGSSFFNGSGPPNLDDYGVSPSFAGRRYFNSSRIDWIDEVVQPGPYRELLPCVNLCWDVVRSCPASFGFVCPSDGPSLDWAYASNGLCNNFTQTISIGSLGSSFRTWRREGMGVFGPGWRALVAMGLTLALGLIW